MHKIDENAFFVTTAGAGFIMRDRDNDIANNLMHFHVFHRMFVTCLNGQMLTAGISKWPRG